VALSVNLVLEATMRTVMTVVLAKELGVEGAALGLLVAELVTAAHARLMSTRAIATPPLRPVVAPESPALGAEGTGAVVALSAHRGRDLAADVVTALASLALLAVLQNADVILLGSLAPHRSGSYAAISVPSKALVFGALVFVNYLLPEATIRHQRGSHALRQLGHTMTVVAVPCAVLLVLAAVVPRRLLGVVFGDRLTAAAPSFSTLVLAMTLLSVTVVLTVYLLGIGWRWVVAVLALGAGALAVGAALSGGRYASTTRADLAVQAGLCVGMVVAFVAAHRRSAQQRAAVVPVQGAPAR
jgi:hypothetical protein